MELKLLNSNKIRLFGQLLDFLSLSDYSSNSIEFNLVWFFPFSSVLIFLRIFWSFLFPSIFWSALLFFWSFQTLFRIFGDGSDTGSWIWCQRNLPFVCTAKFSYIWWTFTSFLAWIRSARGDCTRMQRIYHFHVCSSFQH